MANTINVKTISIALGKKTVEALELAQSNLSKVAGDVVPITQVATACFMDGLRERLGKDKVPKSSKD